MCSLAATLTWYLVTMNPFRSRYRGFQSFLFATDVLNHRVVSVDHDSNIRVWSITDDPGTYL